MSAPHGPIDALLDNFVEQLRPPHDRIAAVPYAVIEVHKEALRDAAATLLRDYEALLNSNSLPPPTPPTPGETHA